VVKDQLRMGELRLFPLDLNQKAAIAMQPVKSIDMGQGPGVPITREVQGGVVGLMLDGRGRPLQLPRDQVARTVALMKWFDAVGLYPTA
jgi:hypothetical protein